MGKKLTTGGTRFSLLFFGFPTQELANAADAEEESAAAQARPRPRAKDTGRVHFPGTCRRGRAPPV